MNNKSDSGLSAANKKQHALRCARERDRWSSQAMQAREEQHQAELGRLRQELDTLIVARDDAEAAAAKQAETLRQQLASVSADRDAARAELKQAELLRGKLADMARERDIARAQLQQAESVRQQLAELSERHDALREQLQHTGALRQQLNAITAERDAANRQVQQLKDSLASPGTAEATAPAPEAPPAAAPATTTFTFNPQVPPQKRSTYRAATAAGVVIALGVLANGLIYHDAQSTVQPQSVSSDPASSLDVLEAQLAEEKADTRNTEDTRTPPPTTRKPKTRFARNGAIELRQWGPALLPDTDNAVPTKAFDPVVKRQQQGLLALGFDIGKADGFSGPRTRQALTEFRSLYLSGLEKQPTGTALAAIITNYADLARSDARNFGIDQGVLAAVRLSSVRTGIEFSYLMKLAAVESNFDPVSKSSASSATGLYQFTRDTWLNVVKAHGDKYGLGEYAGKIEYTVDRNGYQRPLVRDKAVYKHLMDLRNNPRVSSMMAAESVKDNQRRLARSFDRKPSEADLYLTHFFGTDGAISFLKALDETPDAPAVDMFPAAAQSNQDIFHPKTCRPRTVDEVYELFGRKFNNWRFEVAAN